MDDSSAARPQTQIDELSERTNDTDIHALVTPSDLKLDPLVGKVSDDGAGAIATFSGVTRNTFNGKGVLRLEYEAYGAMALKKMVVRAGSPPSPGRASELAVLTLYKNCLPSLKLCKITQLPSQTPSDRCNIQGKVWGTHHSK